MKTLVISFGDGEEIEIATNSQKVKTTPVSTLFDDIVNRSNKNITVAELVEVFMNAKTVEIIDGDNGLNLFVEPLEGITK